MERCSPSGVNRSRFGSRPRSPGLIYPLTGVRSRSKTTAFLWVELGPRSLSRSFSRSLAETGIFGLDCCYVEWSYVILSPEFVKLLVFKGLASESPPLDRKRQALKISLRCSPNHRYQPCLWILTGSEGSPTAGHLTGGRFVYFGLPDSQYDSPNYRRGRAWRVLYTGVHRVPADQIAAGNLGVRTADVLGCGGCFGGRVHPGVRIFETSHRNLYLDGRQSRPLGPRGLPKPNHLPLYLVPGFDGALFRHPEQFSPIRAADLEQRHLQPGGDRLVLRRGLSAADEVCAGGLSQSCRRAGDWHRGGVGRLSGDTASGLAKVGDELPARCEFSGSGRAPDRKTDGAGFLRRRRVSDQFLHRHDFRHLVAHAFRQHHLPVRLRSSDGTGAGRLRHGAFHRDFSDHVASGRGRQTRRDETNLRVRAAHRFVHYHSRGDRADLAPRADYPGAVPARGIRGAIDGADLPRAALLFAGTPGVRGDQADHAHVLLHARHFDSDQSRNLFAGAAHSAECGSLVRVRPVFVECQPGAGQFAA